ncbi:hypothetical protein KUTeg_022675 [Tegillarca granosa]|uniref:GLTSCR protein conserved domain-containing protein n=1 Tax=Tegillarca granosa TaxID=220873 RepID=A0ABQ9E543_TEGGR|nr:hypothetical protein KUTeg_022675 [Tegillarca granosa]
MVVSDMDNGGSLIDVIDESELFEAEPSSSDFSWADDFISSSEDGLGVQGGSEVVNQTTHGSINTGQLAQPSLVIQQASQLVRTHEAQTGVQVIQTNHGMVQQQKPEVQNVVQPQQILSNLGNFQQGSGNQIIQGANGQLILKTASGQQILLQTQPTQQIQQIQQHGQTPSQQIQGGTPLASRSLTPSQSPVPISSPHIGHAVTTISRSMTPNQSSNSMTPVTMVTAAKSQGHVLNSMNAPNVNVLQLQGTSQSQQVLTRNIPLQGVIQMANPNTNNAINLQAQPTVIQNQGNQILQQAHGTVLQQNQGQATLVPGQGQNIVNTQNTVIQNPNVVNVNVAHVLCNNQLQNQQGGTVHHMANIQGTLIQTPDGKYIITQNPQLAQGQSVNFQNISQVALQQQQINVAGQTANQAAGSVGQVSGAIVQGSVTNTNSNLAVGNLGNVLRIAAQPSNQDKQNLATNATHFIGVNQQGQQVLIQRAPAPNNQQQNVILRTVNPANFLQIQQQLNSSTFGASSQAGQVAQQPLIMTSQQQQSAQLQKVIGQPGQQVKLFGPGGLQTAGPVTLNLAGQNINLQNLQGSNAVQTIQIVQQQQQQQQQLQQIQLQQQQIQKQVGSASGVVFSEFTNQENRTISPAPSSTPNTASMISSQSFSSLSQKSVTVSSSQVTQQLNQQNIFTLPNSTTRLNTSQIQQVRFATSPAGTIQQHVDNQVQGSPQQLAQSLQNIQLPLNQFSALNAPSLSTASPTVVTTTVSQTRVTSSNINVTNSPLMTQSVQPTSAVNMTPPKPPILQARINAPKLNQSVNPLDVQKLQQIQTEISKYSTIKNLTSEQKKHYMTLIEAHRRIVAQNPMLSSKKGQVVIQTTQASVVQAASKLLPDGQQQQVLVQSVNQQQTSVVDNKGLSTGGIQFNQHRTLQSQPGTGGLILAGNNLVNQSALFSTSTPVLTSTTSVTSSISSISSIPVPVQSFNSQTSPQPTAIQSNSVVTSHITATQSLSSNPVQTSQKTGLNQSIPVQNTTTVKVPVPTTVVQYNVPPGKVAIPASPQVAVPTQIKIGNHILSLNLTPQQKEKVQGYLSKLSPEEQQAQLATFLRLQAQQQLQNQIRAQVQNQQQQQTQKLLTTQNTATQLQQQQSKIPSTVQVQSIQQQAVSDKPVINTTQPLDNQQTVIIAAPGQKLTRLSVASIPKSQLIQQQLSKDQANALNPDVKSPFKTRRDTYRRLLRYHVYQSYERPDSAVQKNEEKFEEISAGLLKKKDWMFNRFHMLLLQESMREKPTSEMVMLQRLMNEDLKEKILEEKRLAKEEPEAFELMPLHLLEKTRFFC